MEEELLECLGFELQKVTPYEIITHVLCNYVLMQLKCK